MLKDNGVLRYVSKVTTALQQCSFANDDKSNDNTKSKDQDVINNEMKTMKMITAKIVTCRLEKDRVQNAVWYVRSENTYQSYRTLK